MKKLTIYLSLILLSLLTYYCSTVPITGRSQLSLVPASQINALSFQQYGEFIKNNKLSEDKESVAMVKRVGANIQKAVETYFTQNNLSDQLKGYEWEFKSY